MMFPIKYHHSNGHCRDMDWLNQYVFLHVPTWQLAKNYDYERHYVSYVIRRQAKRIHTALETTGEAMTCAAYDLSPEELATIEVYYQTKQRPTKGGEA